MKTILTTIIFFISVPVLFAQTGPAGVGGHEDEIDEGEPISALWLRAEDLSEDYSDGEEVPSWDGYSEYGHEAVTGFQDVPAPVFKENKIHGFPWVEFSGENFYRIEDHEVLDGGQGIAVYAVLQQWIEGSGTIVSKGIHWNFFSEHQAVGRILTMDDAQHAYDIYFDTEGKAITAFINGNLPNGSGQDVFTDTIYGDDDQTYLIDYVFNKNWGGTLRVNGDATVKPGRSEGNPNPITLGEDPVYDGTVDLRIGVRYWDPAGWQNPDDPAYTTFLQGGLSELIIFKGELDSTQMILVENYLSTKYNTPLKEEYQLYFDSVYYFDFIGIGTETGGDIHNLSSKAGFMIEGLNNTIDEAGEYLLTAHNGVEIAYVDSGLAVEDMERWSRIWNIKKTGSVDAKISFDFFEAGLFMDDASTYALLYSESDTGGFQPLDVEGTVKFRTLSFEVPDNQLDSGYYTLGHVVESTGGGGTYAENYTLSQSMHVYPNPVTNNKLHLELDNISTGTVNLRILDYTGRELYHTSFEKVSTSLKTLLDLPDVDNGYYFLEITMNGKKGIHPFLKQ